jgi:AcrR family transcriptional regulator
MPRPTRDARERILAAAYKLFFRQGFTRVGVDEIALSAGITKRTLYYHFASKDDLLAAVLEEQRPLAIERIRRFTFLEAADPASAIAHLKAEMMRWFSEPHWSGSGYTRIVFELADLPGHPARRIARVHKAEVEAIYVEFLTRIGVAEAAARARELVVLIEGAMALTLIHGGTSHLDAALELLSARLGGDRR